MEVKAEESPYIEVVEAVAVLSEVWETVMGQMVQVVAAGTYNRAVAGELAILMKPLRLNSVWLMRCRDWTMNQTLCSWCHRLQIYVSRFLSIEQLPSVRSTRASCLLARQPAHTSCVLALVFGFRCNTVCSQTH